jgi:putative tryptophan/tyrosine transport system substrate-binding protein
MFDLRRRQIIALLSGVGVTWSFAAQAQLGERKRRIGILWQFAADDPATGRAGRGLSAFRQALEQLGWSEGRNVDIDYRFAGGSSDRYLPLAQELIASRPDVILATGTPITATLQRETRTIPIVFTSVSDPIGAGFVASLAQPRSNITGVLLYEAGIIGKWLAMLKEIEPRVTRAALVGNPKTTPFHYFQRAAEPAASSLAIELVPATIENSEADIERVIESFAATASGGLVVLPDTTTAIRRDLIIALAARNRLPAVYPERQFVDSGGLLAYSIQDMPGLYRQAATYVDRILRGAKPADLPVQAPTKYETVVNLKTAKALGIEIPPSLLVRADEVIE